MMSFRTAIAVLCVAAFVPGPANAEGDVAFASAADEVFESVITDIVENTPVTFTLGNQDIRFWEEDPDKRYVFISLSAERAAELSHLIETQNGNPLRIAIRENFVLVPAIDSTLLQQGGLVLQTPDGGSQGIAFSMLDRRRKRVAETSIVLSPPAREAEVEPAAGASEVPEPSDSGSVDGDPQSILKPSE